MPKALKDYTDEEIRDMSDDELEEHGLERQRETDEEREEREAMGAPGSKERRSLYARFTEKNTEAKELRDRLARLEQERDEELRELRAARAQGGTQQHQQEQPDPAPERPAAIDVKGIKRQYFDAMRAGDFDEAAKFQESLDAYSEQLDDWRNKNDDWKDRQHDKRLAKATSEASEKAVAVAEGRRQESEALAAAAKIFETYPFLDSNDKEAHDPDAVAAVKTRRDELIASGVGFVMAMKQAAHEKGPRFAKINGYDSNGDRVDDDSNQGGNRGGKRNDAGETRTERALRIAADAANRQPNNTGRAGAGARDGKTKLNVRTMTDAQLAKLSDEELAEIDGSNRVD